MQVYNSEMLTIPAYEIVEASQVSNNLFKEHIVNVNGVDYTVPKVKDAIDVFISNYSQTNTISFRLKLLYPDRPDQTYWGDVVELPAMYMWESSNLCVQDILFINDASSDVSVKVVILGR